VRLTKPAARMRGAAMTLTVVDVSRFAVIRRPEHVSEEEISAQ
jgi:hypothetical protein